ncbi:MAG: hypothetical protein IPH18_10960 [Chitinophagaceae bacterium]|nr:hypothetical protein [Chitinophagaceae bacterium]
MKKRCNVALLGFNAVAVIDVTTETNKDLSTGWGRKILISKDEKEMYVISCRGYGAGPNGGKDFIKPIQRNLRRRYSIGYISENKMPDAKQLAVYSRQSISNTMQQTSLVDDGKNPLPQYQNCGKAPSNTLFTLQKKTELMMEVLGQMKTGNGDLTLADLVLM